MLLLTGEYELTIDEKNRLSIPARLREQIDTEQYGRGFYLVLGVKASGSIRKKSFLIAFGFILVFTGLFLTQLPGSEAWISLISPSVMILGFILLVTGYRIQL